MPMDICPRHTRVVQEIATSFGTLIREHYVGYPASESNVYMVDDVGNPLWFAERIIEDDVYSNPIVDVRPYTAMCGTWKGFDCEIDLRDGKIIHAEFTK